MDIRYSGCRPTTLLVVWGLVLTGCTFDSSGVTPTGECGDGVVNTGEECDDGNTVADDGCDPLCQIETPPGCGNGNLDAGEECDDGNTIACDDCSPTCRLEGCGNGVMECYEECDDGNTVGCDGCSASCTNEGCGNGTIDCGEECDDGNTVACDDCSPACLLEGCGNGTIECGEVCDTGNVPSSCAAEGYHSGTLGCNASCNGYDTSPCIRSDGQDCTSDSQCVGNICYTETQMGFPLGYCTSTCVDDGSCTDGVCRNINGENRCYRTCNTTADCRPGYYCRIDPWTENDLVCRPLCTSAADCPITLQCNIYTGRCNSTASATAGENGTECGDWDDCKGTVCLLFPPGGYCVSQCNISAPFCPGDGVCSAIFAGSNGDLGYCLDGCLSGGDCSRSGYNCESNPTGSGGTVCWYD
jgi:cysteine-rich repeat protein